MAAEASADRPVRFARAVFLIAGVYGLLALAPLFFLEEKVGRDLASPITHPEFYYGFLSVAAAWQFVFLMIAKNPLRYRAIMIPSVLEKFGYVSAVAVLFQQHRASTPLLFLVAADFLLGVLFLVAFFRTARHGVVETGPGDRRS